MGYVFNFQDAQAYSQWVSMQRNHWAAELESALMLNLLKPAHGESVLNIGCGTGASTLPLLNLGLNVTGIDPSPYMLDLAQTTLGRRVDLYRGFAEDLPFDDNSFNHAFFFISLEFVEDPAKALEEACRVAKDKVFIGFINRYTINCLKLRVKGLFNQTIYNQARFFSVWGLKKMAYQIAGPIPIVWRTVCQLPVRSGERLKTFEKSDFVQRCPFGTFAGISLTLIPRVRTRPLAIRHTPAKGRGLVVGSVHMRKVRPEPVQEDAGRSGNPAAARIDCA